MTTIIDGKEIARGIREKLQKDISKLKVKPGLAVVLVGENPASKMYVNFKEKAAKEVGFHFELYREDENINELDLLTP